jgi:hypothetical protein
LPKKAQHQGTNALHHSSTKVKSGNHPAMGLLSLSADRQALRVPFFGSFLGKQKRTIIKGRRPQLQINRKFKNSMNYSPH